MEMASAFFTKLFHDIPHFTFALKKTSQAFTFDINSDYVKSLIVFLAFALFVGAVLLVTIIITWICQCCTRRDPSVKSRRRVRQISIVLFIISIFCFFALGISLFANEHINRGITSSVVGLEDVAYNFRLASAQCSTLNETFNNATWHVEELSSEVEKEVKQAGTVDEKVLSETRSTIESLNKKVNIARISLGQAKDILSNASFLARAKDYGNDIEFERWVLLVTLLSIMLIVLFVGVIAFCRQSKKGAVMFSGLGFAIFIVGWLLLAIVFPSTIGLADFCYGGSDYIRNHISKDTVETLNFFENCEPHQTHDNTPTVMGLKELSDGLSEIQKTTSNLDTLLPKLLNESEQVTHDMRLISDDVARSLKGIGGLETQVACYAYHNDVNTMRRGLCETGMFGSALLVISLLALGLFMFLLLLIVSKSWYLFKRLPSDYVEVDDEDPFFPRGNDSTIPVDIYGTHVYNPRTRYANSLDRTEPSTGTTIAPGIPNGSTSTQPSASTALLAGESEWQRATAPPSNPAMFSSPPAVGTNSMVRSAYTVRNDDACRYRNYQEQFDV